MAISTVQQVSFRVNPSPLPTVASLFFDHDADEWALVDSSGRADCGATVDACRSQYLEALRVMADHLRHCRADAEVL